MGRPNFKGLRETFGQEVHSLQKNWGWIFAVGILMALCGLFAIANLLAASVVSLMLIGTAFFVGGFFMLVFAFQVRAISRLFWSFLISGILFILSSVLVMLNPAASLMVLTLFAALSLGASGLLRMIAAIQAIGFAGWVWLLLSGLIAVGVAILIAAQLQMWSLFLPGLFLGIDILFNGLSMAIFGWRLRP